MPKIKNLVFGGGGVKGAAHVGMLDEYFQEVPLENIERVAGTSAGAMIATLVAVGYTPVELVKVLQKTHFNKFLDDTFGPIRNIARVLTEFGLCKGDYFIKYMKHLVAAKTGNGDLTFRQLHNMRQTDLHYKGNSRYKDLYIVTHRLPCDGSGGPGETEVFSHEEPKFPRHPIHPDDTIVSACAKSAAVPFAYKAKKEIVPIYSEHSKTYEKHLCLYVDGGLSWNFAIDIFDKAKYLNPELEGSEKGEAFMHNTETLGSMLDSHQEFSKIMHANKPMSDEQKIAWVQFHKQNGKGPFKYRGFQQEDSENIFQYSLSIIHAAINVQKDGFFRENRNFLRTVFCDTGQITALQTNLTKEQEQALYEGGVSGVLEYKRRIHQPESREMHFMHQQRESKVSLLSVNGDRSDDILEETEKQCCRSSCSIQ